MQHNTTIATITNLLRKKVMNLPLNEEEEQTLQRWMQDSPYNREVFNKVMNTAAREQAWEIMSTIDKDRIWVSIYSTITTVPPAVIQRASWLRYAVAAAIIILAIGSGIYYFNTQSYKSQQSNKSQFRQITYAQNIPPGTDKAIWTLSSGQQIQLDSTLLDMTTQTNDATNNGFNELRTPRGGQYQLILPDGSKVWLNAASSIKYPVVFNGKERKVDVTGEVYFEIAKDASKPFKVSAGGQQIEVLGTAFNINAYDDEPFKTSLAAGAIKINQHILKPGQAYTKGKIITTNIEEDIAWKSGLFQFNRTDLDIVMRQIARWYDVEVIYEQNIPPIKLGGTMSRDLDLSQMLEILGEMGVHYRMENRKIIITP